jgi:hypothetical protein
MALDCPAPSSCFIVRQVEDDDLTAQVARGVMVRPKQRSEKCRVTRSGDCGCGVTRRYVIRVPVRQMGRDEKVATPNNFTEQCLQVTFLCGDTTVGKMRSNHLHALGKFVKCCGLLDASMRSEVTSRPVRVCVLAVSHCDDDDVESEPPLPSDKAAGRKCFIIRMRHDDDSSHMRQLEDRQHSMFDIE